VPILVLLGLSVLDLGPMCAIDRQTSDAHHRRGGVIIQQVLFRYVTDPCVVPVQGSDLGHRRHLMSAAGTPNSEWKGKGRGRPCRRKHCALAVIRHAISSYCGNRPTNKQTNKHTHTNRQDHVLYPVIFTLIEFDHHAKCGCCFYTVCAEKNYNDPPTGMSKKKLS